MGTFEEGVGVLRALIGLFIGIYAGFMNKNYTPSDLEKKVLNKVTLPSGAPKEIVWDQLQTILQTAPQPSIRPLWRHWGVVALFAASFVFFVLKFYRITVYCPAGERLTEVLPDGSEVSLNAGSSLSYVRWGWRQNRAVTLDGEAFFKVQKGSRFTVESEQGTTEVLGTSFNIYARRAAYIVICETGKVLVTHGEQDSVYLKPQEKAILVDQKLQKQEKQPQELAWLEASFYFNAMPLQEVLEAIQRHYAISIKITPDLVKRYQYTGYFKQTQEPLETLQIITISLGLTVKKVAPREYVITA